MVQNLKLIAFFFFSSVFAFINSLAFHELGHAIFVYSFLGTVPRISINPFSGAHVSYAFSSLSPWKQLFITSGGIFFGLFIGVFISWIVIRYFKNVWGAPFLLTGVVSVSINSLMLFVGIFLPHLSDISKIISWGTPVGMVLLIGLLFLLVSLYFFIQAFPLFGFDKKSSLGQKLVVMLSSVFLYAMIVLIYAYITEKATAWMYLKYIVPIILCLGIAILIGHNIYQYVVRKDMKRSEVAGIHVTYSLSLVVVIFFVLSLF